MRLRFIVVGEKIFYAIIKLKLQDSNIDLIVYVLRYHEIEIATFNTDLIVYTEIFVCF